MNAELRVGGDDATQLDAGELFWTAAQVIALATPAYGPFYLVPARELEELRAEVRRLLLARLRT